MGERWFTAKTFGHGFEKVDRESGVIRGVAVIVPGEAKGHGVHIDREFTANVIRLGNEKKRGVKARFGHPTASGTALGTNLGRFKDFRDDGGTARADLHLLESASLSPNGDLRDYVLSFAEEDPEAFGASITFDPGRQYQIDANGEKEFLDFDSGKKTFIEIENLHATDLVDDPAAAPNGLFSADGFASKVTEFLDYNPQIFELLNKNPEVINGFLERYSEYTSRRGDRVNFELSTDAKGEVMDEQELEAVKSSSFAAGEEAGKTAGEVIGSANEIARFGALLAEFPEHPEFASEQFVAGSSIDEAKGKFSEVLKAELAATKKENEELAAKIDGGSDGIDPLNLGAGDDTEDETSFGELVEDYRLKHKCTKREAISKLSKREPKAYAKFRQIMAQ